jgi:hypothetical protein
MNLLNFFLNPEDNKILGSKFGKLPADIHGAFLVQKSQKRAYELTEVVLKYSGYLCKKISHCHINGLKANFKFLYKCPLIAMHQQTHCWENAIGKLRLTSNKCV